MQMPMPGARAFRTFALLPLTLFTVLLLMGNTAVGQPVLQPKSNIPINWECEFYYGQLLTPTDLALQGSANYTIEKIPSSWTNYRDADGKRLNARSCATYRIQCLIKNPGHDQLLALYIPNVHSSYSLWIDGTLTHKAGIVSSVPYEAKPRVEKSLIPFTMPAGESGSIDTVEIVMQTANFTSPKAGIATMWRIGDFETLHTAIARSCAGIAILIGMLLTLFIATLIFFSLQKKRKVSVWTPVLLLFVALAVATSSESQLLLLFPSLGGDLYYSLRAASRLASMVALLMLLRSRYPYEFSSKLAYPLATIGGLAALLVTILPSSLYLRAEWGGIIYLAVGFSVATLWVLPKAIRNQRDMAVYAVIGLAALGVAMAIDHINATLDQNFSISFSLLTIAVLAVLFTFIPILDASTALSRIRSLMHSIHSDYQSYCGKSIELSNALRKQNAARIHLEEEASRRRWSDEGQQMLRKVLVTNRDNFGTLCQKSLEEMARYVKSKVGVLYVARVSHETNKLELQLVASYGLDSSQRDEFATCAVGEGIVGASFLDNTPRFITDVPKSSIKVNSGLGRSVPKSIAVQPLESDAGLVGVIELGRFTTYKQHEIDFIQCSAAQLANSIMHANSTADSRRQIEELKRQLSSTK